jgi:hypothetical protein
MLAAHRQHRGHIFLAARQHHHTRHHPVVGCVRGVQGPRAGVGAHVPTHDLPQGAGQGLRWKS